MAAVSYKTGVIEVAANAYAFRRENGATNAGFIVGEEGVIAVDSPMTPTLAGKRYAAIKNVARKSLYYPVNTHYHGDHVFGNQDFLPAPVIRHANCRTEVIENFGANMQRYRNSRPELIRELEQIHMFSGAGSDPPDHAYGVSGLPKRAAMGDCGVQAMRPSSETVGMGSPAMTQEDSDAFRDLYGVRDASRAQPGGGVSRRVWIGRSG
jgi:hypothetical protein